MNPDSNGPSLRTVRRLVLVALAAIGLNFWHETGPVRLATPDDVAFQAVADHGNVDAYLALNAREQGRFLYCTPLYRFVLIPPYALQPRWLFGVLRTTAFLAQIGLVAWLAARVLRNPAAGWIVALALAGTLHLPQTFYLVLSVPPMWLGFPALLGALHFHLTALHRPHWAPGFLAGLLFLLAMLMHDVFVVFLPLFPALAWLERADGWRGLLRANLVPVAVALAYVVAHRSFAREFPTAYDGTQFSLNVVSATQVVVRQLVGVIPGFELVVNRPTAGTGSPLWRELPDVLATFRLITGIDLLVAAGTALGVTVALRHALAMPTPRARLWPWAVAAAVLATLPIAFSAKYQVFIMHREFPYGYAWFSFCFLGVAAVGILLQLGGRFAPGRNRLVFSNAAGAGTFLLNVSALASNHRVLQVLAHTYN